MARKKLKINPRVRVLDHGVLDKGLTKIAKKISKKVVKDYHLSYPDVDFHLVDLHELASIVAANGWIVSPQHWTMGQSYYIVLERHKLLPGGIAEIVVNSGVLDGERKEPINAYIYALDDLVYRKLVITHVFGHAHIYYNNRKLNENRPGSPHAMMYEHAQKVYEIEKEVGKERVEDFLDTLSSLSTLIDLYPDETLEEKLEEQEKLAIEDPLLKQIIESPIEARKKLIEKLEKKGIRLPVPEYKEYDMLKFLEEHADVTDWQRELIKLTGEQFRFLYKGALCRTIHEGFADLVQWRYAIESNLEFGETFSWMKKHVATQGHNAPGRIREGYNPYALGFAMLRYVMEKWADKRFGIKYDYTPYVYERRDIRKDLLEIDWEKGWKKVLDIVANHTDYTFLENFFTPEFYNEYGDVFFVYEGEGYKYWKKIVTSRKFNDIRNTFLFENYNLKLPRIYVKKGGGNYNNKGELYLIQDMKGLENLGIEPQQLTLHPEKLEFVLKNLYKVWKKPVHLETIDVVYLEPSEIPWYWWYRWYGSWPWFWPDPGELPTVKRRKAKIHKIIASYDGKKYVETHTDTKDILEHLRKP